MQNNAESWEIASFDNAPSIPIVEQFVNKRKKVGNLLHSEYGELKYLFFVKTFIAHTDCVLDMLTTEYIKLFIDQLRKTLITLD